MFLAVSSWGPFSVRTERVEALVNEASPVKTATFLALARTPMPPTSFETTEAFFAMRAARSSPTPVKVMPLSLAPCLA